uniref:Uncharacterized protein n=1 Tax=Desulfovibrio sp. U5L TaxID=596152 RepID=I2Q020_9BACT
MAGSSGAYQKIYDIQTSSTQLQQTMLDLVTSATSLLASPAVIPEVSVSHSGTPTTPTLSAFPATPSLPAFSDILEPTAPTAPSLETTDVADVDIPVFSISPPSIVFPNFDDIEFPAAPGDAPAVADITIPADPEYVLPDAPTWEDFEIPAMPAYVTPNFEGSRPTLPAMDTPGQVFFYEESQFSPALWEALQAQLLDDIQNGGDVSNILALAGMFAEQERWVLEQGTQRKEVIAATWRAKGYTRLPGPALAQLRLVDLDIEKSLAATKTQAVAKQAELSIQYRQFVLEQAATVIANVELAKWNASNNRALEAAKVTAEMAYQDVDARVKLYNLSLALFQADAAVFEAKLKASLSELDAYKTAMEGARIRGELRDSDVKVYLGRLQGVAQVVEIYKGRLQGAATQAEVQKAKLQAYETQVQSFVARVNAVRAQYDCRVAQITGEKAKADVYDSQVRAYTAQLGGAKTVAEIGSIKAGIVSERNKTSTAIYQSNVEAYRARWQGVATQVEKMARQADALVRIYAAETQGVAGENDSKVRAFASAVQAFAAEADASIKEASLLMDRGKALADLNERALAVTAQVSGQGLASALSQIHGTASLGSSDSYTEGKSESHTISEGTTVSTQTSSSRSYGESYNYNTAL